MDDLTLFDNPSYYNVRVHEHQSKRWMSAVDVCAAIGYKNPRKDWYQLKARNPELAELSVVVKMTTTDGKRYDADILDITGISMLCMLARTEEARKFRRWAAPLLGAHVERRMPTHAEALEGWAAEIRLREVAEAKVLELSPKAQNWDEFLDSNGLFTMQRMAGMLGIGRGTLFHWVRELEIFPPTKKHPLRPIHWA